MDFTWVLGCINTKWALHGLGLHCGNCDLCHFLQHIQIFPVNFNYSARTALYGYIIKEKTNTNNIVIVKETNSQHLLPCKIILGTCLVSKQYQELIKTNHFSSKALILAQIPLYSVHVTARFCPPMIYRCAFDNDQQLCLHCPKS